jgi:uncharacterized protein (DUF697 family)/tellurite resistance protein
MEDTEIRGVFTVALAAAMADGRSDEAERGGLKALAARLGEGRMDLLEVYEDVLRRKPSVAEAVAPLASLESRRLAFEAAASITSAGGARTPPESAFLDELATALGLPAEEARTYAEAADAIAATALVPASPDVTAASIAEARPPASPSAAELEKSILDASLTNAALELLPDTLASMAILPLQARLVYRIGKAYGYELDQRHIGELAATLGIGLTGQYLEQFGRKLLGGLLGGVLGAVGRMAGRQAASSGMAFATTWALGQVAMQYYGGGRHLDAAGLRAAFAPLLDQGRGLLSRYAPEIERRAAGIDLRQLPQLVSRI